METRDPTALEQPREAFSQQSGAPSTDTSSAPDARFSLANERTFLAWNRTALAFIAAGVATAEAIDFHPSWIKLLAAVPLVTVGGFLGASSRARWLQCDRAIRNADPIPPAGHARILAPVVGLVAIAALAVVVGGQHL